MYLIQRTENAHTNPDPSLFRTVSRCKTPRGAWSRLRQYRAMGGSDPLAKSWSFNLRVIDEAGEPVDLIQLEMDAFVAPGGV